MAERRPAKKAPGLFSLNDLRLGMGSTEALERLDDPSSRCWVPDNQVTLMRFGELALHFSADDQLVKIRGGTCLKLNGKPILWTGDPDEEVEARLGPAPINVGELEELDEEGMKGWTYQFLSPDGDFRVRILSDAGEIFDISLEVGLREAPKR